MKRLAVLSVLFLTASSMAFAGGLIAFGLHANGASINVSGELKDAYGPGYGGGAHVDFNLPVISLRVSGDYISFSPDNDKYRQILARLVGGTAAAGWAIDGGSISILSANANVKWGLLPLPIVKPYLTGGVGLARLGVSDATVKYNGVSQGSLPGVKAQTQTAFNVGLGVDFSIGVTLFIEAKYTWILTEGETSTYAPVSIGITF